MTFFKYSISLLFLIGSALLLNQCYLLKQGAFLLDYHSEAQKIDKLVKKEDLDEDTRTMLLLVKEIKRYSVASIGLKDDKNYTKYVNVGKDYLVDVVSACEKDRFEPYQWGFPFFGKFPYKGFFEQKDAEREAERLVRRGFDVLIRKVDAFSTLGFFVDPVYSFMKDYSVYSLASLIIHEQTHATIFLKNRIQFNEELATFVGKEGALNFIKEKYGKDSEYYREIVMYQKDFDTFFELLRELYRELDALYNRDLSREYKLNERENVFRAFKEKIKEGYRDYFVTDSFRRIEELRLNNAYIMSMMRYTADLSIFYELYDELNHDLREMVAVLKRLKGYKGDPKAFLKESINNSFP